MIKLVVCDAKVHIKIEFPNKILLFIENLCFCRLKIAVCVPKSTIESKNCRLKIAPESKNYGLKIPVRVRMYARMYARAYDCQDSTSDTRGTRTAGTRQPEKRGTRAKHTNKICDCWEIYTRSMKKS